MGWGVFFSYSVLFFWGGGGVAGRKARRRGGVVVCVCVCDGEPLCVVYCAVLCMEWGMEDGERRKPHTYIHTVDDAMSILVCLHTASRELNWVLHQRCLQYVY